MKKNYTFLAAICLATAFTVGCSKSDDSTSSTQTQTQTGGGQTGGGQQQSQNAVTTDFLQGTWKVEDVAINNVKLSTSTEAAHQALLKCYKLGNFSFSKTEVSIWADRGEECNPTAPKKSAYTLQGDNLTIGDLKTKVSKEGDFLVLTTTEAGKTTKEYFKRINTTYTPVASSEKQAVAKVTITGTQVAGSKVLFYDQDPRPGGITNKGIKEITNGKVDFDVKEYIGKKLYFVVMDPRTNRFLSELVEHTITEGDNAISIALRAIQPTGAKITVTKDGSPLQNQDVYFATGVQLINFNGWKATQGILSYSKSSALTALQGATKVTTDAQGLANASISAGSYKVVVLLDNDYKELDLTVVDEQVKEATISFTTVIQKVDVTFSVTDIDNRLWDDVEITVSGQTKRTSDGRATFQLDANRNYSYTTKTPCGETKTGRFITTTDARFVFVDYEVSSKGTIIVQNRSNGNNPYTVKVNGIERTVRGGADLEVKVPLNQEIQVSWKQISGYAIYPTTGQRNVTTSCSEKVATVTFH